MTPWAKVIKTFCPKFTYFHTKIECFLKQSGKACQGQTLRLLQKFIKYGQKSFITLDTGNLEITVKGTTLTRSQFYKTFLACRIYLKA